MRSFGQGFKVFMKEMRRYRGKVWKVLWRGWCFGLKMKEVFWRGGC